MNGIEFIPNSGQYVNMAGDQKRTEEAQKQNKKAQDLNSLAAIILPFSVILGIFGMNDFFEIVSNEGTWIVIIIGFILSIVLLVYIRRKTKE
ncbi:MAG: hypothetical protein MJZ41_14880 [Bacteroidaceae bacterium]|nr:hypothetical protein [Bacteroidaceae bacterium]